MRANRATSAQEVEAILRHHPPDQVIGPVEPARNVPRTGRNEPIPDRDRRDQRLVLRGRLIVDADGDSGPSQARQFDVPQMELYPAGVGRLPRRFSVRVVMNGLHCGLLRASPCGATHFMPPGSVPSNIFAPWATMAGL